MPEETNSRRYRKRKRALQEERTRQRITEAAVELHGSIGPARTSVTEIADRAGVSRMTVYNHFPTDADLFGACSTHWFGLHPLPDPDEWAAIPDPGARVLSGLGAIYAWYREAEPMMENVLRDAALVTAVDDVMAASWSPYVDRMVDVLAATGPGTTTTDDRRVVVRLLVDFRTWQAFSRSGLDDDGAAALAARILSCADPPVGSSHL